MAQTSPKAVLPLKIEAHQKTRRLELEFDDGQHFFISYEMLRVYTPSAERVGHDGQIRWEVGKAGIGITAITAVGDYAITPVFSDGHNSGIYSWEYLYFLGSNQEQLWQSYQRATTSSHE